MRALRDREGKLVGNQRFRHFELIVENVGAALVADRENVAEALSREKRAARRLAFDDRIGDDCGGMNDNVVDHVGPAICPREHALDRGEEPLLEIAGGRSVLSTQNRPSW